MKKISRKIIALSTSLWIAGFIISGFSIINAEGAEKKVEAQTICPVQGGPIDKSIYTDYKGYRIYFCCIDCPDIFKKNPEKYMKILKDSGVTLEKAPKGDNKGASSKNKMDQPEHHRME